MFSEGNKTSSSSSRPSGARVRPQHQQVRGHLQAGGGGQEEDHADARPVQPRLPHHHRGRRPGRRHQPQTVAQPPQETQGTTPHPLPERGGDAL